LILQYQKENDTCTEDITLCKKIIDKMNNRTCAEKMCQGLLNRLDVVILYNLFGTYINTENAYSHVLCYKLLFVKVSIVVYSVLIILSDMGGLKELLMCTR
jgi:hypothetical protein